MSALHSEFSPREDHRGQQKPGGPQSSSVQTKLPRNEQPFSDVISTHRAIPSPQQEALGIVGQLETCKWPREDSSWATAETQLFPSVWSRTEIRMKLPASAKPSDCPGPTSHPLKVLLPLCPQVRWVPSILSHNCSQSILGISEQDGILKGV